ncbi:hypothetical protein BJ165DRAFT_439371 [Panaeolus papilionaceus]|nr:hypothetical protein BJ165DRAFT_439371 [Panaeolus papilionaceus]
MAEKRLLEKPLFEKVRRKGLSNVSSIWNLIEASETICRHAFLGNSVLQNNPGSLKGFNGYRDDASKEVHPECAILDVFREIRNECIGFLSHSHCCSLSGWKTVQDTLPDHGKANYCNIPILTSPTTLIHGWTHGDAYLVQKQLSLRVKSWA